MRAPALVPFPQPSIMADEHVPFSRKLLHSITGMCNCGCRARTLEADSTVPGAGWATARAEEKPEPRSDFDGGVAIATSIAMVAAAVYTLFMFFLAAYLITASWDDLEPPSPVDELRR